MGRPPAPSCRATTNTELGDEKVTGWQQKPATALLILADGTRLDRSSVEP